MEQGLNKTSAPVLCEPPFTPSSSVPDGITYRDNTDSRRDIRISILQKLRPTLPLNLPCPRWRGRGRQGPGEKAQRPKSLQDVTFQELWEKLVQHPVCLPDDDPALFVGAWMGMQKSSWVPGRRASPHPGVTSSLGCEALTCPHLAPQLAQLPWERPVLPQGSQHQPVGGGS